MERVTLVAEGSMLLGSKGHLLHKVTAPRSGDVTNLISIKKKKKTTEIRQNEETEEYISNEGKDKI